MWLESYQSKLNGVLKKILRDGYTLKLELNTYDDWQVTATTNTGKDHTLCGTDLLNVVTTLYIQLLDMYHNPL